MSSQLLAVAKVEMVTVMKCETVTRLNIVKHKDIKSLFPKYE